MIGLSVVAACIAAGSAAAAPTATDPRPNIVLIVTDDQRADAIDRMPHLRERLIRRGITFANAFHVNPLCCPARAAILTGLASQRSYVWTNAGPFGGWSAFRQSGSQRSTAAVWLRRAGYRTGAVGKYLNGYSQRKGRPLGWDVWRVLLNGSWVNENGRHRLRLGYRTDLLADWATRFIRATPRKRPLFLLLATSAPHAPAIPAARHQDALSNLEPFDSPAFNEADVSDKPAYVRARPPTGGAETAAFRLNQYRSLLAVDEAIGRVVKTLRDTGRLANTLIVFTSDNGVQYGEHRLPAAGKLVPYEGSLRMPLIVRWDREIARSRVVRRMVTDIDLAPTFAAVAGVPQRSLDGRSLVPILTGARVGSWRRAILIENAGRDPEGIPNWCGVRTGSRKYVAYSSGEEELYDLKADPFELENVASDPSRAAELEAGRSLTRALCFPLPPATLPAPLCLTNGTEGPDLIIQTAAAAYACTRGGADEVQTGPFADTIVATPPGLLEAQAATFTPRRVGPLGATISTGAGNDRVAARNGELDTISCGTGRDRVVADHFDVLTGCERVERPPVPPPRRPRP